MSQTDISLRDPSEEGLRHIWALFKLLVRLRWDRFVFQVIYAGVRGWEVTNFCFYDTDGVAYVTRGFTAQGRTRLFRLLHRHERLSRRRTLWIFRRIMPAQKFALGRSDHLSLETFNRVLRGDTVGDRQYLLDETFNKRIRDALAERYGLDELQTDMTMNLARSGVHIRHIWDAVHIISD